MQSIKTRYNGIEFRSGLEARWAKFFDWYLIKWVYEPEGYQMSDGTRYLPDFYLPDQDQFFEVKGIMNVKDMHKIEMLVKEAHKAVIIGLPDGAIEIADITHIDNEWIYEYFANDVCMALCRKCGKWWFMNTIYSFECRCCGEYDGDHHILEWYDNSIIQKNFKGVQIKVGKWN